MQCPPADARRPQCLLVPDHRKLALPPGSPLCMRIGAALLSSLLASLPSDYHFGTQLAPSKSANGTTLRTRSRLPLLPCAWPVQLCYFHLSGFTKSLRARRLGEASPKQLVQSSLGSVSIGVDIASKLARVLLLAWLHSPWLVLFLLQLLLLSGFDLGDSYHLVSLSNQTY